jgi:hypothetical protein
VKKIIGYLREFIKENFNPGFYVSVAIILIATIWLNYGYGFKRLYIDSYYNTSQHFWRFLAFFAFVYFFVLFLQSIWKRDFSPFKNKGYLLKISAGILLLAFDSSSRNIFLWLRDTLNPPDGLVRWTFYVFTSVHQFINLAVFLIIFKYIFDRREKNLYGLTLKNFDVKPYFIMLAIMLPLVAWASFQQDFLRMYPIYKDNFANVAPYIEPWKAAGIFEISYAIRFVAVELFFRGFLVVGMVRLIGERAIVPMAVLYSFWHFGKPMMETVGAFFGGYILGVIAMRTGSVFGGIIVHMGIALLMDAAAYIQIYLVK